MTSEHPDAATEPAGRHRMRGSSFGGLILRFFASAVAAMLLFEAPALGASPAQLYAGAQPEGPEALPVGAPSAGGDDACKAIESPRMSQYLNGEACPPVGFPCEPQMVKMGEQIRMTDPSGACTSGPISPNGLSFDFRTACRTHDYGYDLLRHRG